MAAAAMKHMDLNFAKVDKFEEVDYRRWKKKMHFLFSSISVVYVLTYTILKDGLIIYLISIKMLNLLKNYEIPWKPMAEDASNFKHTLKHEKEELTLVELGNHGHVHFKRMQDMFKDRLILAFDMDTKKFPKKVTKEVVVQQPEPELSKSKRNRTLKNYKPEFKLYLTKGTRDKVSDQHSSYFNVDPKTFDEAMKS
nr:zinc finger, CCHC-type [Tanacetum cinerariifolium]